MATTKLSDKMIREMLMALINRRTDDGRYETFAPARTRDALEARGKVEREEYRDNSSKTVVRFYLTTEAVTLLRHGFVVMMGNPESKATEWHRAAVRSDYRIAEAAARLVLGDITGVKNVTTTNHGRPHTTELGPSDAVAYLANVLSNGQRVEEHGTGPDGDQPADRLTVHMGGGVGAVVDMYVHRPAAEEAPADVNAPGQQYGGITREDVANGNGPAEALWRAGEYFKMYDAQHPTPAAEEAPAPRMVASCCSCGAGIEMPMDGPRPACTHEGETRPNGGIVLGGRVVRRAERGTCYTDRHIIRDVERWESGNTMARCAECVALDLGVSVDALPGYKPEPRPAAEVLAADPIPADTAVLHSMPGEQLTRAQLRTPRDVLTDDAYVVQVRSERVWQLPNHDDGAHMTRGSVAHVIRSNFDTWTRTRAAIDTDGTVYLSAGHHAARYIPARLIAGYAADFCPGCDTPYAVNGDGPCEGGRSLLAPGSRDYDAEAAALLGDGAEWVRHGYSDGKLSSVNGMNRREALQVVTLGLKRGEVRPADDGRGVRVEFPDAKSAYWLEPVTVQPNPDAPQEAARDAQVNRAARWVPEDPAEEGARPYVEIGGVLVFVYREGGRLVVSVDLDTAEDTRDDRDSTVPMMITVQGNTVFEG